MLQQPPLTHLKNKLPATIFVCFAIRFLVGKSKCLANAIHLHHGRKTIAIRLKTFLYLGAALFCNCLNLTKRKGSSSLLNIGLHFRHGSASCISTLHHPMPVVSLPPNCR